MKFRLIAATLAIAAAAPAALADITIGGTSYHADTLLRRQVGPGMVNTIIRIPDYPLNVYLLETDLNNAWNRVETQMGQDRVGSTEGLVSAYNRHRAKGTKVIAATNSNFWVVSSQSPWAQFELGTPFSGSVRNDTIYVNTETINDTWIGGPEQSGAIAIDGDKRLWHGRLSWAGQVTADKLDQPLTIYHVNRRAVTGDLALYNEAYTSTREFETNWTSHTTQGDNGTDNYYLDFAQGSDWLVNQDMRFVVSEIVRGADRQTLGSHKACLAATGDWKNKMSGLEVGDELVINQGWTMLDGDPAQPHIAQLIAGNAQVMHQGELTERNYTLLGGTDTYNTQVYSRTGYGSTADGKHLYQMVIDKSISKLYGRSAGCSTEVMCEIFKSLWPDVSEVTTHDAGGSAQMMVEGEIINTTTEGTPRAVSNGWMLVSTAPADSTIASIAFDDYRVTMPVYSSYTPKILGYNQYGDLVSHDVQGVTLGCDPALGTAVGGTLVAGGNITTGTVTATMGGISCTAPLSIIAAQPAIAAKPVMLVDQRSWPIEVTATVGNTTYDYDPAWLDWTVADPTVATVQQGCITGLQNGDTQLLCSVGSFADTTTVQVQISDTPTRLTSLGGWELKGAGATNLAWSNDSTITYTYKSNRAPYVRITGSATLYGLPDSVWVTFTSSLPIDYLQADLRNPSTTSTNYVRYDAAGAGFEAGVQHSVALDLAQVGGSDRISTYPLTLAELRFAPNKAASTNGEQSLVVSGVWCHYPIEADTAPGDVNADGSIDASDVTTLIAIVLGTSPSVPAADLDGNGVVDASDVTALIARILGQ